MWWIFLVVVAVVIYFILQLPKFEGLDDPTIEAPLDILNKRYAKGEIEKEEFDQKKNDLE